MKYVLILWFALIVTGSLVAQYTVAPVAGSGTQESPYEITSLENLYWITASNDIIPKPNRAARWSSHYIQIDDINASRTANWFEGKGWIPIGFHIDANYLDEIHPDNLPFSGSYNGNGFTIDSLVIYYTIEEDLIDQLNNKNVGLFGYTDNATIENLGITNVRIRAFLFIGGMVGVAVNTTINNCYVTGVISGDSVIGGLVGKQVSSIIKNCHMAGKVNGIMSIGGLVGRQEKSAISTCYNTGYVVGSIRVGGIVGSQEKNSTITKTYNTGEISSSYYNLGGIAGLQLDSKIINCYNTGLINGSQFVGGLTGLQDKSIIRDSYSTSKVTGDWMVGSLAGVVRFSEIINCYWIKRSTGKSLMKGVGGSTTDESITPMTEMKNVEGSAGGEGRTTDEMTFPYAANTYLDWDFNAVWAADFNYDVNHGYPYLIDKQ